MWVSSPASISIGIPLTRKHLGDVFVSITTCAKAI